MKVTRIINRSERVHCFPPITIWPADARAKRQPGETAAVILMPDGTEARPVRVYSAIVAPPGVTSSQDGLCPRDTAPSDVPQIPLTQTHDDAYWAIVLPKAAKAVASGEIEFRGDEEAEDKDERKLREMGEKARGKIELKARDPKQAVLIVENEDSVEQLKAWKAIETRPAVKKAINERLVEIG